MRPDCCKTLGLRFRRTTPIRMARLSTRVFLTLLRALQVDVKSRGPNVEDDIRLTYQVNDLERLSSPLRHPHAAFHVTTLAIGTTTGGLRFEAGRNGAFVEIRNGGVEDLVFGFPASDPGFFIGGLPSAFKEWPNPGDATSILSAGNNFTVSIPALLLTAGLAVGDSLSIPLYFGQIPLYAFSSVDGDPLSVDVFWTEPLP